jgi:hypothetical protein
MVHHPIPVRRRAEAAGKHLVDRLLQAALILVKSESAERRRLLLDRHVDDRKRRGRAMGKVAPVCRCDTDIGIGLALRNRLRRLFLGSIDPNAAFRNAQRQR